MQLLFLQPANYRYAQPSDVLELWYSDEKADPDGEDLRGVAWIRSGMKPQTLQCLHRFSWRSRKSPFPSAQQLACSNRCFASLCRSFSSIVWAHGLLKGRRPLAVLVILAHFVDEHFV